MKRRELGRIAAGVLVAAALGGLGSVAWAADEAPEAMIKRLSDEVMAAIKADKGRCDPEPLDHRHHPIYAITFGDA